MSTQIMPASQVKAQLETWVNDEGFQKRLAETLPEALSPKRFAAVALSTLSQNPNLLACTPISLMRCMVQSANVGLEIGNGLGHAYLVPFRDRKSGESICTLILGYRGLVQLLHRSAAVSSVYAQVVREGDDFDYEFGLHPKLKHRPEAEPNAKVTHAYAIITMKDGSKEFEVMNRAEIEAVRSRSRASASGPWVTDYPEMAKKTCLRRLAKLAPMSVEDQRLATADELADAGQDQVRAFAPMPEIDALPESEAETVPDIPDGRTGKPEEDMPDSEREARRILSERYGGEKEPTLEYVANALNRTVRRLDDLEDLEWQRVYSLLNEEPPAKDDDFITEVDEPTQGELA